MGLAAVCADPEVAALLVARGTYVVLCGTDPARLAAAVAALRHTRDASRGAEPTGGRLAVMVGNLADPEVEAAARAMAAELFGEEPVLVKSRPDAGQQTRGPPGPERAGSGTV